MRIAIGSDHAGFDLKQVLAGHLRKLGHEVCDLGPGDASPVDYPRFARAVSLRVAGGGADLGVLACGTGQGMAMCANKVAGVRAAVCADGFSARAARQHNDANVLCLGQRVVGQGLAIEVLDAFLEASFLGGRHARRVAMMRELEDS